MAESLELIRQSIVPFGTVISPTIPGASIQSITKDVIIELIAKSRLLVFRGFSSLDSGMFVQQAEQLGSVLEWNFGKILELVVHANPKNYLFTNGDVPLHWDGAFAELVPSYQFFQCLEAPSPDSGGETVFTDTVRVLEKNRDKVQRWREIKISYRTEKVAHYGGSITQPLIGVHPKTGEETIRYAEPMGPSTSKENPLEVVVCGASQSEQETLLKDLRTVLYDPECCYAHEWKDGDFILSDNHALLHGRRPFKSESPRHIQRIHII